MIENVGILPAANTRDVDDQIPIGISKNIITMTKVNRFIASSRN